MFKLCPVWTDKRSALLELFLNERVVDVVRIGNADDALDAVDGG